MNVSLRLLPVLLVLSSQYLPAPTYAQTQLSTDSIRFQTRSAGDTLAAIHQIFLDKRSSARAVTWTGVGLAAVGSLVALGSYALVNSAKRSTSGKPLEEGAASVSLKYSLPGLLIITLGLIRRIRFNQQREAAVVSAFAQNKSLPRPIRRLVRNHQFANQ